VNDGAVNFGGPGLIPLADSPLDRDGYPGEQIGTVDNGGIVLSGPVYVTRQRAGPCPPPHHPQPAAPLLNHQGQPLSPPTLLAPETSRATSLDAYHQKLRTRRCFRCRSWCG